MKLLKTLAAAAAATLFAFAAQAGDYKVGDLVLEQPWTRATPPNAKAGGGFVTITNQGADADRLIGAAAGVSDRVEIHEMAVVDGVMKMRELENGIEIPAGETVMLQPGGLHIMFMGLNGKFEEGTMIPVTLTFEKAGTIDVELAVGAMGSKTMNHSKHHNHGN
ncbi:hypothetical protein GCM10011316_24430 [Roseibium aquae]|uniref:Copper chaperone PCu(A)C n=1 Tax=Roseibium aquae TaxID=1323746 RepID=A0A916X0Y7_9HYPH|nr:copper chaperone PCu(A)C [Roseibium aquae]GGB51521.1 hypothetical protein GCM10011316_24430 [Roseibium aquae]